MIRPNPTVAAMDSYALPDITAGEGLEPIVLAQNEHAWPPSAAVLGKPVVTSNSALMHACLRRLEIDYSEISAGGYLFTHRN